MKFLVRQCHECGKTLPLEHFDEERETDKVCVDCKQVLKRMAARKRHDEKKKTALVRYMTDMKRESGTPRTDDLTKAMLQEFGGLQGYVGHFGDFIRDCRMDKQKRTSKTYLDALRIMATLIKEGTSQDQNQQQLEARSNEELLEMFMEVVSMASPEAAQSLLENAAEHQGFRLISSNAEDVHDVA